MIDPGVLETEDLLAFEKGELLDLSYEELLVIGLALMNAYKFYQPIVVKLIAQMDIVNEHINSRLREAEESGGDESFALKGAISTESELPIF